ncbi:MAG: NADH-quinone oxidoreductase subunit J [Thermoplasmata archaeon]|nr:NADH-quinone oxidoreductase subunit J [Thermoplasmata archaeon]
MSLEELAFLGLAFAALLTATLALLARELVHTILWVAGFFLVLSAIYFLLEAPFLGVLQLGIYAGAVTILLLFGIMVTRKRIFSREAVTGLTGGPVVLAGLSLTLVVVGASTLPAGPTPVHSYEPALLSSALFNTYGPWLLLLGLVMLAALAGAIYLVREERV